MSRVNGRVNLAEVGAEVFGPAPVEVQVLLMELEIYSESIFRTVYENGKPVSRDEVSPVDVAQALAGLETGVGVLPRDVLFWSQRGDVFRLGIYLPAAVRTVRVEGKAAITLPLPALVFAGQGQQYQVFAVRGEEWPGPETALYRAPFPNVRGEARGVCAGSVEFPPCRPETIHAAARLFFESYFNLDLANGKSRKHPHQVWQMWQEVAGAGLAVYPEADLVEAGVELGDLVDFGF